MERYLVTASLFTVALLAMLTWRVRRDAGARVDSRYLQMAGLVASARLVFLCLGTLAHIDPTQSLFTLTTVGTGLIAVHLLVLFAYSFPDNRTVPLWFRASLIAATATFTLIAQNHTLTRTAGPFILVFALMPSYLVLALIFVRRNWRPSLDAKGIDPVKLVQVSVAGPWALSLAIFLVLHALMSGPLPAWIFLAQALLMTLTILGGTAIAVLRYRLFDVQLVINEVVRAVTVAGIFSGYVGLLAVPLHNTVLRATGSSALAAMLITGIPPLILVCLLAVLDRGTPEAVSSPVTEPPVVAPPVQPDDAALGAFAAAVAHDIRTPLTSIQMNVQVLRARPKLDDNDREHLDIALAESHRLKRSVDEMLDYARPVELHPRATDPGDIVRDVVDSLLSRCAERGVVLLATPPANETSIVIDETLVRKALTNLVHNATDASSPSGVVEVTAEVTREHTAFCVRDQGKGISPEQIGRIFEPFYSTRPDSLGLGLTVARKIAMAHGGDIHVESNPTSGTRVTVSIPRIAS
jgi:signal transduction histidine kinase